MAVKRRKQQCTAKAKSTGERCRRWAVNGSNVCRLHGAGGDRSKAGRPKGHPKTGGGPPPEGNLNAKKHGAYSARLQPEEQPRYESIRSRYEGGFENLSEIDKDCIHRLAMFEVKLETALESGAAGDALEPLQRMIHRELKALQATREAKDTSIATGNSPAEVVAALFMKAQRLGIESDTVQALPDPDVIDVDVVEVKSESEKDGGK